MEKFIFLATIRDRLIQMNLTDEAADKHVKIFENCLKGKSADEIDKIIESAGGVEGILKSIENLEKAKNKKKTDVQTDNINTVSEEPTSPIEEPQSSDIVAEEPENLTFDDITDDMTQEIEKSPDIDEHIKEAEFITAELEKTTINEVVAPAEDEKFELDISEYDFEKFFAEKLTLPEKWIKKIKEKLSPNAYKATLPLAVIIYIAWYAVVLSLFPLLLLSAVACSLAYIAIIVCGIIFALIPIGFGIYMCFKTPTIGMYEIGIGITVCGSTMLTGILLYNYVKRLVPFLFRQLKILFAYTIRITKKYFQFTKKEEK